MQEHPESHPQTQQHIIRTRSHPGYTRGGGGARSARSRPKRAAHARPLQTPSPHRRGGRGGSPEREGEGRARLRGSVRPRSWGRGGHCRRSPHPRQASPRAPPGAPLTREREWGSVRGRVGSNSNLSDLKRAGRPPKIERDRSCARPRAGTAPLRAPRPPQGEWRGTPRPSLSPSLPAPPPALVPPLSPPPLQRLTPKFPAPRADTLGARSPPLPPACTAPPSPAPPARAHRPSGSLRARAAAVAWPTGAVAGAGAGAAARS